MNLARVFLSLNLILSLVVTPPARAEMALEGKLNRIDTQRFFSTLEKINRVSEKFSYTPVDKAELTRAIRAGSKDAILYPASWAAHTGQTFFLLWILAAVEAIRQQERMKPIETKPSPSRTKLLSEVAERMINNHQIFASMAGSSVVGSAMAQPLSAFDQLVKSTVTSPYVAKLIATGAASYITFIGWEAGSRLWQDATLSLNEADIKIAQNLRFFDILLGHATKDQERVFKNVLNAAYEILLFAKPQMTRNWIYNTWRLNIATGEFVTIVTSMVTAGVTVGSLAPVAGQLMGLLFGFVGGLAGGTIAIMIPHEYKASITDGFRRLRISNGQSQLAANENELQHASRYFASPAGAAVSEYHQNAFIKFLKQRGPIRDDINTALFEQVHDAYVILQEAELTLSLIETNRKQKLVAINHDLQLQPIEQLEQQMRTQQRDSKSRLEFYFRELLTQQQQEAMRLGAYLYKPGLTEKIKETLNRGIDEQSLIHSALRHVFVGISPDQKYSVGLEDISAEDLVKATQGAHVLLNLFYLQSFQEKIFLE